MDKVIGNFLIGLKPGVLLVHKNMAVIPLVGEGQGGPRFTTMKRALAEKQIIVREVSEHGSVPDLLVENLSALMVLLLDGEELAGAKQNRILNTSILVRKGSRIVVPVSCTEHGRWSYSSKEFMDSDVIMSNDIRKMKMHSVTESLKRDASFYSNQGMIWEDIAKMSEKMKVNSKTGAMKQIFADRKATLDEYVDAFPAIEGQVGLAVFINGKMVGLEALARVEAYADYHERLVRSYAMDALDGSGTECAPPCVEDVSAFIRETRDCDERSFKSRGAGTDWRYEGGAIVGAALKYGKSVIHAAFFKLDKRDEGDPGRCRTGSFRYDQGL